MNFQIISEHIVDMDLLPEKSNILDLGCLGFDFTNYFRERGHNVKAVDIQHLDDLNYQMVAISDFNGTAYIVKNADKQAVRIQKEVTPYEITSKTLPELMKWYEIVFFDLIKIDVEGSEYEIIMSLDKAPAKQLSIEFHLHTGIYGKNEMDMMENKLKALGYEAVSHELTTQHSAGFNYWNSLFILK